LNYDDLIGNNRRRIGLLEDAARQLYKEWFVRFRFPGHEHIKIVDGMPEGWEVTSLSEIALTNVKSYTAKNLPDMLRYIDISAVNGGNIAINPLIASDEAPGRARRIANHGDVIWSNVRPDLRAYALVMHPDEFDVFSTGFTVLSSDCVPFSYLYLLTTTDAFVSYLVNRTTGSSYPAVRPDDFDRADVVLPPQKLLTAFHELCEPSFELATTLRQQNANLAKARDLLLPRLMNGTLSV
jgi:type I restriction enzyme, S subunit